MSDPHERLETACALSANEPIPSHRMYCLYCAAKQNTILTLQRGQTISCDAFSVTNAIVATRHCANCSRIIDILISQRPEGYRVTHT